MRDRAEPCEICGANSDDSLSPLRWRVRPGKLHCLRCRLALLDQAVARIDTLERELLESEDIRRQLDIHRVYWRDECNRLREVIDGWQLMADRIKDGGP